jgi:CheY-like chemotaxis protein/HPt (histidine-containing phosphotransfer) domain-containing protein
VAVDFSRLRVLAVDDHPVNRELLADVFEEWGVVHSEAESGEEALRLLRHAAGECRPYDVVISDFHMPGMDGLFLATAIRAEPEIGSVAIVVFSSSSYTEDQQRRLAELGINAHLLKPLRQFQLRSVLINLLEGRELATTEWRPVPPPPEDQQTAVEPAPAPPVLAKLEGDFKVLLAEDNEVNIEIALDMLKGLGLSVDCAANGREAVEAVQKQAYDLIFMDCQMPEMDGFEATQLIRQTARSAQPIIIAMTAYAMEGDKERCLAVGMDDYLPKPVTFSKLSELAEKYLQVIRQRRQKQAAQPAPEETPTQLRQEQSAAAAPRPEGGQKLPPLFDLAAGLQVTGGNHDVLKRAISIWWRKMPTWLADLKEGVQRGDLRQVAATAHTLRGAASNIGALSIARYAERMETDARQNSADNIANLYECLVVDIERLRQITADLNAQA